MCEVHLVGQRDRRDGVAAGLRQLCRSCVGHHQARHERHERSKHGELDAAVASVVQARQIEMGLRSTALTPLNDALWWGRRIEPRAVTTENELAITCTVADPMLTPEAVRGEIVLRLSRAGLAGASSRDLGSALSEVLSNAGVEVNGEVLVARKFLAGYRTVTGYLVGPLPGPVSNTNVVAGALISSDEIWFGHLSAQRDGSLTPVDGFHRADASAQLCVSIVAAAARLLPSSYWAGLATGQLPSTDQCHGSLGRL